MNTFNFMKKKLGELKGFILSEVKKKKGAAAMELLIRMFIGAALGFVVLQVLKQAFKVDLLPLLINYVKSFFN